MAFVLEESDTLLRGALQTRSPTRGAYVRKQRWTAKVKTGCITCKIRRVKCDEGKPSCQRCVSTGRTCDGYDSPIVVEGHSTVLRQPLQTAASVGVTASRDERQTFHFFRTYAAAKVAGAFDKPFWTADVPRAAQAQPAVWHAVNALSAMYKRYTMTDVVEKGRFCVREVYYRFALGQYNASIRHLAEIARQTAPTIAEKEGLLIASALFTGLCSLRGDQKEAFVHMRNGLKLFRQWKPWKHGQTELNPGTAGHLVPTESLSTLFNRLNSQCLNLMNDASRLAREPHVVPRELKATKFDSATEAYFEFEMLLNGTLELLQGPDFLSQSPRTMKTRYLYGRGFYKWKAKFQLLQESPHLKPSDAEAIACLRVRQITLEIALKFDHTRGELAWDDFVPQFESIVSLSEKLSEYYASEMPREALRRRCGAAFSFNPSVCEPLYFVGSSCRSRDLRRRAIELLRRWPRREGVWDTELAATITSAIMKLEEEGALESASSGCGCVEHTYICHGHRVFDTDLELLGEGQRRITMRTVNDASRRQLGRVVELAW